MAFFRPLILCYHTVSDTWNDPLAMRVADFERQLQGLKARGYRGATAAQVLERPADARLLHITFDDGFKSVENAYPILERLEIPATVFLCTDFAESGRPLLIPELAAGRAEAVHELATLDWEAVRALSRDGIVSVGSHTATHAHLTRLSDTELEREVRDAKLAIEDRLERPCDHLAYPYGEHDVRVRRAVESAGFLAGFAAPGTLTRFDRFQVPRAGLWRDESPLRLAMKTRLAGRLMREWGLVPARRSAR